MVKKYIIIVDHMNYRNKSDLANSVDVTHRLRRYQITKKVIFIDREIEHKFFTVVIGV